MASQPRVHKDYTVGWVCALPKEQTAAIAMLDQRHTDLPRPPNDHNTYTLGSIASHNIVVACLPKGKIGTTLAATVASQMINAFPSIKFGLMVGIGGGIPPKVRLGDIVVGIPSGKFPGVVQWDHGKQEQDKFTRTGSLNNPPRLLLSAVGRVETENELEGSKIPAFLDEMVLKYPRLAPKYLRSESFQDDLFQASYDHKSSMPDHADGYSRDEGVEEEEETCRYCDRTQIVIRKSRDMSVHHGLIASGNSVIKNATFRDNLCRHMEGDVLCVEMEAAGLVDSFPCLVIRGICDYADSHKNKVWQEHAAALAAAYAKELLGYIQPSDVEREQAVKDLLGNISSTVSSIRGDVTHTRLRLDKEEDIRILDWLSPTDYGPQQSDYLRRREPGTGQWLLVSQQYQDWIRDPSKTLFCPGIPGAGKTILTSVVIDDLEKRFRNDTATALVYVYYNYKRQSEQTFESMLSSILKQLARSHASLPHILKELYNRHMRSLTNPSLDELSHALESITAEYSRVFIIVDALDESSAYDNCRNKFLSAIFSLQETYGMNIFATSRPIPEIMERFRGILSIEIRATENDIRNYVCGRLPELRVVATHPELQDEIIKTIANAVDGMFLLAQLHFTSLIGKDTPRAVRKALQMLATGSNAYDSAYNSAMQRIIAQPSEQAKRATQVLSWVTCAKTLLTRRELQHALAVESGESEFDEDNLPEVEDAVSVCAGLVTIDGESGIVRLVHYTTQDYFARTQSEWFPDAQLSIMTTCTTYLSYRVFASGSCETDKEFEERLTLYPLYAYAAQNWVYHARGISRNQYVIYFLLQAGQVEASFQAATVPEFKFNRYSQRSATNTTGLHLAAYFGLDEVMETMLADCDVDATDSRGWTPLLWAAHNGHEAVVRLLLASKRVNPDSRDKFDGRTPLSWAAHNGHEAVVRLLLASKRVNPDSRNKFDDRTPLSWAAYNGHEAVVRLLLATKRVNLNSKDKFGGWTPLSWAAHNGHEAVVRLLLATERVTTDSKDKILG
ncbi:hypothetical protein F4678DRAFT_422344 [Xylaria arbuscula]|nr:hypothetical protein F4678DRAFT_422344 [Xylaria arbuscula]